MASIANAVSQILAADLPILFVDTCSLLDVIRAPFRQDKLQGCVESASELLALTTISPCRCVMIVGSFVSGEWADHAGPTSLDLDKHLARLDSQSAFFHDLCRVVSLTPPFGRATYGGVGLAAQLQALSKQLLDRAIQLEEQDDVNLRAYKRAATNVPPSRKGGEIKDSTITEECLEVCRQLQGLGFSKKRVFCTSNTADYCDGGDLHPTLAVDFGAVGLTFVTTLSWAVHEIKT